jgi:glycosyltransferase involved in cell wall biosynthesis
MTGSAPPVLVLGTASIHVERFVRGLCAAGRQVVLASHGELPIEPLPGLLERTTVDLGVASWSARPRIRALVRRWRPGVVHAHQANSVSWHAVAAAGAVPVVVTLWGSDVLQTPLRSPWHRWMVRRALRGAAAWTADARVLLDAAAALAGPGTRALREWIPIGIAPPPPPEPAAQERRILSCRLHKPLYRIDAILRAFARLPPALAPWVLEVAAGGSETAALQRLAGELGLGARVEFTGMLGAEALARAYRRSALFVSVPESDGTSVSLLEAMAAGCLPVLSDLPANREWVTDSTTGVLCGDLGQLDAALRRAIECWESGRWASAGLAANRRLIEERALFPRNIEQFAALHDRLQAGRR